MSRTTNIVLSLVAIGLVAFALTFFMRTPAPALQHNVYIWQRVWTNSLIESLKVVKNSIKQVRVLALEKNSEGEFFEVKPHYAAINSTDLSVYAVIRLDGRIEQLLDENLTLKIIKLTSDWEQQLTHFTGVEIDYDCPTSQLSAYHDFLKKLRVALPSQLKLSTTALPTWMESLELHELLALTDESVLQVHAVLNPKQGLFDSKQALAWAKQYRKIMNKPFQIALPAYGSNVLFSNDEKISAIQSEQRVFNDADNALELSAEPAYVANFIHELQKNNFTSVIWFRLPTTDDRRAWPLESLLAVMNKQVLESHLIAAFIPDENDKNHNPNTTTELLTLDLLNQGNISVNLPEKIHVAPVQNCTAADGLNGYELELGKNSWIFKRDKVKKIMPQQHLPLAWLRCSRLQNGGTLNVNF